MSSKVHLSVQVPKSEAQNIEAYLRGLPNVEVIEEPQIPPRRLIKGKGNKQVLATLSGAWNNNAPRLSADEIRKQAWQRNH
jgi:hypothetical protein